MHVHTQLQIPPTKPKTPIAELPVGAHIGLSILNITHLSPLSVNYALNPILYYQYQQVFSQGKRGRPQCIEVSCLWVVALDGHLQTMQKLLLFGSSKADVFCSSLQVRLWCFRSVGLCNL